MNGTSTTSAARPSVSVHAAACHTAWLPGKAISVPVAIRQMPTATAISVLAMEDARWVVMADRTDFDFRDGGGKAAGRHLPEVIRWPPRQRAGAAPASRASPPAARANALPS